MDRLFCALVLIAAFAGCGSDGAEPADLGAAVDAVVAADLASPWPGPCAPDFGSGLTAPYGRLDGTIWAVVEPGVMSCTAPNGTHLVIQVAAGGDVYRMVVNVLSDRAVPDPRVSMLAKPAALAGGAWAEGWHAAALDYVNTLAVHSGDFTPLEQGPLVAAIESHLVPGAAISVFASTSGGASAHLVHRNVTSQDGAIVIDPRGNPRYLLFRFADQTF